MKLFLHKYDNGLTSWKNANENGVMLYQLYLEKQTDSGVENELIKTFYSEANLDRYVREYINDKKGE